MSEFLQKHYDQIWQERYKCLISFFEVHQHIDIPRDYLDKTGSKLYYWVKVQVRFYHLGTLLPKRKRDLEKLSAWSWDKRQYHPKPYKHYFTRLKNYFIKHGKCPPPESKLGRWYQKQKSLKRLGKLSQERIKLFDAAKITLETKEQKDWFSKFEQLKNFGSIPAQSCTLGTWAYKQRQRNRKNLLSNEKVEHLNSLGFWSWEIRQTSKNWDELFAELKSFISKHRRYPKRREKLGSWFYAQRAKIKKGKLANNKAEKLFKLPEWRWLKD